MVVTRESCVFLIMDIRSYRQIKVKHEEQVYQETLEFLKAIPLTKEWSNMSLISLLRQCKTVQLTKNNIVYNIGDPVDCVYFIKQGEIEVSILNYYQFKVLDCERCSNRIKER